MDTADDHRHWRQLAPSLRTSSHARWEEEEGYSLLVNEELRRIFALLRYDRERDFLRE